MAAQRATLQPYFLQANDGEATWFLATRTTVKASSAATGEALTLLEVVTVPGGSAPWHIHRREDELCYVLEGDIVFKCGDAVFRGGPGSFVFLPRDIPHSYKNVGATNARWLLLATPAGAEGFFLEAGVPATEAGLRPQPLDPQQLRPLAAKYGLEILGPPPFSE